ncbi:MAG: alpha-1,4-glucan--maltose-1-phosphate maltosyltransferase [Deltaproteobacteria bacterium RIFOXYA12_FULL_58_15]|nr:MAG: alpha-1,4-glucan--maltose-1-phosphate maltosyltransferase [Deltaproteobacteria bacterium RIFOXYA12_FULL_58_15]OGR14245.1 MAG: alpha-1,4-glucan--maltose-1-phosphate maltosyltransferase [Deltaproteobacteria bacterium RIFOXYB12_FULL_58_9]
MSHESPRKAKVSDEQKRVRIEEVSPVVNGGRFPIKRVIGERVVVRAHLISDGHDELAGRVVFRHQDEKKWTEVPLASLGNDEWEAEFEVKTLGRYVYTVHAWVDSFLTWRHGLERKAEDGQDVGNELLVGAELTRAAAGRAKGTAKEVLDSAADTLGDRQAAQSRRTLRALGKELLEHMTAHPDRSRQTTHANLEISVDRERARFSTWYELFPRSASPVPNRHGTFRDVMDRLPYIAQMGFDVLYFPPIHPIGTSHRKGKNNSEVCQPGEPGSPWAIGNTVGGHKSIHSQLGTDEDFDALVVRAHNLGIEIALDIAFQCSPDHPYVKEHPSWFRWRPDGTVQYAENPPKKYQDIFPFDFETDDWRALWEELESVFQHWIARGVRIFRVDNPHTKAFPFWEWVIDSLKRKHRDLIFLAEAFTRPKIMYGLAKVGFNQSYTYFTWRNSKTELETYLTELTKSEVKEFFRPNFWPNTPDILHAVLQEGGRPAFAMRYVLAATLSANVGIYGPVFELCENEPREPGAEENRNSEKYEIRHWDLKAPHSLSPLIAKMNTIRHDNPALQTNEGLQFHTVENDNIICYSKATADKHNVILTVVNLDSKNAQDSWIHLDLPALGLEEDEAYQVTDLLSGAGYGWRGAHNWVRLDPSDAPGHVFHIRRGETAPDSWL